MVRANSSLLIGLALICFLSFLPIAEGVAIELQLPPLPPTIEELTNGKVKIGDQITKDNVDLVKEYLPLGLYECVKNGMVLKMGKNPPPEKINPKTYLEATEKNRGKAVVDDHMVVRYQDGSEWPGGIPFPEPKTAQELMGNYRFGIGYDNYEFFEVTAVFLHSSNNLSSTNRFFSPHIIVSNHRYWNVTQLRLPSQDALRIYGHPYDVRFPHSKKSRLSLGRKSWTLNTDVGSACLNI